MATNGQVAERYAEAAPSGAMLRPKANNVFVSEDGRTIYSYGRHFPMARIMPEGDYNERGWWLANGDRYSVTTSAHQSHLRSALARTGLPVLIVPFSVISAAGIREATITPVDIRPAEYEMVTRRSTERPEHSHTELPDGTFEWNVHLHHLGASVFTADYLPGNGDYTPRTAAFLSAFDDQEGHGLYFLAQMPEGVHPATVAEAFAALRPMMVQEADDAGLTVTRQGDVFAIPSHLTTRDIRQGTWPAVKGAYVLGVNHTATEVVETPGATFARGTLRHRPRESWRQPEHKMQRMGDGKTWHRLVKNTVPEGRSWSVDGRVD
jgi:hypothetical protein